MGGGRATGLFLKYSLNLHKKIRQIKYTLSQHQFHEKNTLVQMPGQWSL